MLESVRIYDEEDVSVPFEFFTDKSYKKTEADVQNISGTEVTESVAKAITPYLNISVKL